MYDTRVYKERRKAKFQSDPEFRLREQQRHRERYQRRKNEKLQQEAGGELILETQEDIEYIDLKSENHLQQIHDHNSTPIQSQERNSSTTEEQITDASSEMHTVSIKLPQTMAVLVVPVNFTSVSDDDAIQLQQIGKRVAIIRGALTNVAEFQVLPGITMDSTSSGTIAMDTDIRQIVSGGLLLHENGGPMIQITPQVIEMPATTIETSTGKSETVPPVPEIVETINSPVETVRKPKHYVHIEGIKCGRCLHPFDDLVSLGTHQRSVHKMRAIDVTNTSSVDDLRTSVIDDAAQILSMESKIAARGIGKGNTSSNSRPVTKRPSKRSKERVQSGKVARGASKVETKKGEASHGSPVFTCGVCSLSFVEEDFYVAHMLTHQVEEVATTVYEITEVSEEELRSRSSSQYRSSLTEYVEEQVMEEHSEEVEEESEVVEKHEGGSTTDTMEQIITASGNRIVLHADSQEQLQELLASLEDGGQVVTMNGERMNRELVLEHHLQQDGLKGEEAEEEMIIEESTVYDVRESRRSRGGRVIK